MQRVSNPFKTPEFLALFHKWNKILEQDGLKEIEDFTQPDPPLKAWHNLRWKNIPVEKVPEIQKYYELATGLLSDFQFQSHIHKRIWELHCEGMSVRKISRAVGLGMMGKSAVHEVIIRIEKASGLKRG